MLKEFFVKRQLKSMGIDGPQLDSMMEVVKDNPGLFQKLGAEIEEKVKKEKMGYQEAALAVTTKHQAELAQIFGKK